MRTKKATFLSFEPMQKDYNELKDTLTEILNDWDSRFPEWEKETHKITRIGNDVIEYWSPAASMVSSEKMNKARKLLERLNTPKETQ